MKMKFTKRFAGLLLAVAILLLAQTARAAAVSLKVAKVKGGGASVVVPITTDKCEGLGALQFDLTYDPAIVEPQSVDNGAALSNGLVEFKIKSPGLLGIALISSEPITEPGELLRVTFKPLAKATGSTPLEITNPLAQDHKDILEMLVTTEPGSLTITSGAIGDLIPEEWKIPAMVGGGVLLVIILVLVLRRGKKN